MIFSLPPYNKIVGFTQIASIIWKFHFVPHHVDRKRIAISQGYDFMTTLTLSCENSAQAQDSRQE